MADVTITTEEPGEGNGDVGVAAGMAVAVAGQAAEDAEAAVEQAEQANETAAVAIENGDRAAEAAYNAQDDVAALRAEFSAFADELRGALAARQTPAAEVEVTEPAPEPAPAGESSSGKSEGAESNGGKEKPKTRSYGSSRWFGDR